jgi:hypothetical protein
MLNSTGLGVGVRIGLRGLVGVKVNGKVNGNGG